MQVPLIQVRGQSLATRLWTNLAGPGMLGMFAVIATLLAFRRHDAFVTQVYDLGYYTQVIWNTAQGRLFATSLKPPTFLIDHFSPLLSVLAPLFWIAPDARTLFVVEMLALSTAIVPAYLLLREHYPVLAPLLVLAFAFNPLLHDLATDEFHEIFLAVPLLSVATYALLRERYRVMVVALLLMLLVREDMGIYLASFGLYLIILRRRQALTGLFLMAAGVIWLPAISNLVLPLLAAGDYRHGNTLAQFIQAALDSVRNLVASPQPTIKAIVKSDQFEALVHLLRPFMGIPLLAAGEQLLWLPALLVLLASPDAYVSSLNHWYAALLLPLLWTSTAQIFTRVRSSWATMGIVLILGMTALAYRGWSSFPGGAYYDPAAYAITEHKLIGRQILKTISPTSSLAIQSRLGAHLATRERLYVFPWVDWNNLPETIVLDTADPRPNPMFPPELSGYVRRLQLEPAISTAWEQDGYVVFNVAAAPTFARQEPLSVSPELQIDGYELAQTDDARTFTTGDVTPQPGRTLRVMIYWTVQSAMNKDYTVSVRLLDADGNAIVESIGRPGRGDVATSALTVGRTIRDTHYLTLPAQLPASLALVVNVGEVDAAGKLLVVGSAAGQTLQSWSALQ